MLAIVLFTLIAVSLGMAGVTVARYPAFFAHPGARLYLLEPIGALLIYAVGIVLVSRTRGAYWDGILKTGMVFGALTGILEVINIGDRERHPVSLAWSSSTNCIHAHRIHIVGNRRIPDWTLS